jgi:hypothetical protein
MTHGFNGMSINQVIAMLQGAQAQGAEEVAIVVRHEGAHHECAGVDWISTQVVNGVAYICPLEGMNQVLPNEAADGLDL